MKGWTGLFCVLFCGFSASCAASVLLNLMPVPSQIEIQEGRHRLDESFRVSVTGNPHERLFSGASRMLTRLSGRTGLFFSQDRVRPEDPEKSVLLIQTARPGNIELNENESYRIRIQPHSITLKSETDIGALHGLETLLQLLDQDSVGYFFPCVTIEDRPRFPWRGLLIDACRHFMPVDAIKRNLDGMAAVKLNVLHWHLTEDQGFRVECRKYPKLHELGSDGLYYSQAQIHDIIEYAGDRGIRVVPEFDMPGHSTSWFVGYPDLASAPGPYSISRTWGIQVPVMNPCAESTYAFLDLFLGEMATLFPDAYMHIGGDEANFKHWKENPEIREFMEGQGIETYEGLQAYFNQRISRILTFYGKKMMGWDEILHPGLPESILIQSWRGTGAMIACARQGIYTILSNGYYIDLNHPASMHYLNDPLPPGHSLNAEETQFILGGEACMWSEFVTCETVDSRVWPRMASIAERLWSPAQIRDVDDMYRRLGPVSADLEELGLTHEKNPDMMLRRLSGDPDMQALRVLADVIEPVKNYQRNGQRDYTSYSPMTRLVDAATPDAKTARKFRHAVDSLAAHPSDVKLRERIRGCLELWKNNDSDLRKTIERSPVLWEARPLAESLLASSEIGLQALDQLEGKPISKKWRKESLKRLEKITSPCGQTELMIIPAIVRLVEMIPEE